MIQDDIRNLMIYKLFNNIKFFNLKCFIILNIYIWIILLRVGI